MGLLLVFFCFVMGAALVGWGMLEKIRQRRLERKAPQLINEVKPGVATSVQGEIRALKSHLGEITGTPCVFSERRKERLTYVGPHKGGALSGPRSKVSDPPEHWTWDATETVTNGVFWVGDETGWALVLPGDGDLKFWKEPRTKLAKGGGSVEGDERVAERSLQEGENCFVSGMPRTAQQMLVYLKKSGQAWLPTETLGELISKLESENFDFPCFFPDEFDGTPLAVHDCLFDEIKAEAPKTDVALVYSGYAMLGLALLGLVAVSFGVI